VPTGETGVLPAPVPTGTDTEVARVVDSVQVSVLELPVEAAPTGELAGVVTETAGTVDTAATGVDVGEVV
jgi:hypothetical protein